MDFSGKTVLITGAAQGIGYACAEAFVKHGATVCMSDINGEAVTKAADTLAVGASVKPIAMQSDVSDADACTRLVESIVSQTGSLDVLVNNAGIAIAGDILTLEVADFDKLMGVNLRGAFLMAQAVARQMVAAGKQGSIINMSSVNSVMSLPNQLAYCMAKGGIAQMTRAMSVRLAAEGVRVNAIGPGSIGTELLQAAIKANPENLTGILARTPLGRLGEPSEIGDIALYLASDYSSYITGETIYADGGRLALGYTVPVKNN
ncbi:SDR family oxidoreductase [Lentibacter algarum]|nr:SDR family oxidoreductase [Lentibacter algarum]